MSDAPLERCLDGEPGAAPLRTALRELGGNAGRPEAVRKLDKGVYRISLATRGHALSLVAKRIEAPVAYRNQRALERWLPEAGLGHAAPALLGVAAEPDGLSVWHLYEDLGDTTLADRPSSLSALEKAVRLVATIHARFARAPVLAECRVLGENHGIAFYESNVRDAAAALRMLVDDAGKLAADVTVLRRLLGRLERLGYERADRARALAEMGGPETLLHGDLWPKNMAVAWAGGSQPVRLIDWDHVGPGSFTYDLSTMLIRASARHRAEVVELYRQAAAEHGLLVPGAPALNVLFTTAEYARLANITTYPALIAASRGSAWAFERLAAIDEWLEQVPARCAA